jgi:hypothetical protein
MPGVVVDAETLVRIRFGQLVALVPKPVAGYDQGLCCVFADDGALLAIARYEPDKVAWQPFKVFL